MAESVKGLTLGFGSAHHLTFCEFKPCVGLHADSVETAWDSLSLPLPLLLLHSLSLLLFLSPPPLLMLSLSLKIINKQTNKQTNKKEQGEGRKQERKQKQMSARLLSYFSESHAQGNVHTFLSLGISES